MEIITENRILFYAGLISAAYIFAKLTYTIYWKFILYFTSSCVDHKTFGKWALVTGSTDGIGKGIARELAKLGINIVLVSRNPEKLKRVADEIEEDFHVEVKSVTFNFTQADDTIASGDAICSTYDAISDGIEKLEIGILVNNVGMLTSSINRFLNSFGSSNEKARLAEGISAIVNCNVLSMVKVTQLILPQMVKRHKGLIINVSSAGACEICPMFALYSGTKKFVNTFSQALADEYQSKGVIVQSVTPSFVITNMTKDAISNPTLLFPSCETYIRHLMKTIGKCKSTFGYWPHDVKIRTKSIFEQHFILSDMEKWKKYYCRNELRFSGDVSTHGKHPGSL